MKKVLIVLSIIVLTLMVSSPAQATTMYSDLSSWITAVGGDYEDVVLTGELYQDVTTIALPYQETLTMQSPVQTRAIGNGWVTWSGGYTGIVFYTNGATSVTGTFSPGSVKAFGLEMEPNPFGVHPMTLLTLSDGTSLTQGVEGQAGAAFFGWADGSSITSMTLSCDYDFAFRPMVKSESTAVPEPATMSLLGLGLLGLVGLRKKKVA